ncbi:MAG: hypothetical protein GTO45_00050 [Candidatus Aminicenantes bacterium]|nr:hypothetical protein [Candidatus Aminicenantes bacterium]NIM77158.1 hypothetical protein [Candidatus Aminicenantes bacterium]NIN16451.1 hypothetical protein [Candidatus Aminicenantes bacterium]NIN40312.1 hypothetical protein [Candidatus Aminicenantes bacterium]NIN83131.1 hypothetical protein [Candidatus Aminicenantes bacterium]
MGTSKVYVYEKNTGIVVEERVMKEGCCADLPEKVSNHNKENPDNPWIQIVSDTGFPPKGFKHITGVGLVEKDLSEKVKDGDISIPTGHKLVGNLFVPKTLKEKVSDGDITLSPEEKLSDDGDAIVKKSDEELFRDGIITEEAFKERFVEKLVKLCEERLDKFNKDYPVGEVGILQDKKYQALNWMELNTDEKKETTTTEYKMMRYTLLLSESGLTDLKDADAVVKVLDEKSNKILTKAKKFEAFYGKLSAIRIKYTDKIRAMKNVSYKKLNQTITNIKWPDPDAL